MTPVRRMSPGKRKYVRRYLFQKRQKCLYCNVTLTLETATIDHLVPLSKGGSNNFDNLVLACLKCNRAKADFE